MLQHAASHGTHLCTHHAAAAGHVGVAALGSLPRLLRLTLKLDRPSPPIVEAAEELCRQAPQLAVEVEAPSGGLWPAMQLH